MARPVPLVLCGKSTLMATNFISSLNSEEYEVIHACHDLPTSLSEIPLLLQGRPISPVSDLSTLTSTTTPQKPLAVIIGKGFSESEMDEIINAGDAVAKGKVAWLVPDDDKFSAYMKAKALVSVGTMLPGLIAERVETCLKEKGLVKGVESVEGGVWGF